MRKTDPERDEFNASILQHERIARRDLFILLGILGAVVLGVFLFDTGSLAEWVAEHRDTKIDEVIVAILVLSVGACIFSVRRWVDLTRQVTRYRALHAEMTALTRQTSLLAELADLLQSCLTPAEAHKLIAQHAEFLFPGSSGAVCVIANSRDVVEAVAVWGTPTVTERSFPPGDCWALRRGRIHEHTRETPTLLCGHLGKERPEYAICVPMMAQGEALGVLYLDSGRGLEHDGVLSKKFHESQSRLARTLAEHIALALANLNLREVLRCQSVRDPLTGLFNRRYMEESLERELRRAVRKQGSLGVMMIDIDHFKRFNDTFGHEAGDTLLKELAKILKSQFRAEDIACRYGGEEFTIILPEIDLEQTQERADKLRDLISHTIAEHRGRPLDRITLSIGVSCYPENGLTTEALLRTADSALYRAKEEGRNRVCTVADHSPRTTTVKHDVL